MPAEEKPSSWLDRNFIRLLARTHVFIEFKLRAALSR
jgi:hypothetical protein